MNDNLIGMLRYQAFEISRAGIPGWGNTMTMAADEIERLQAKVERLTKCLLVANSQAEED